MKLTKRGGSYFRVADPEWAQPLDGSYSMVHGGRWNAPGSFAVVYLNQSVDVARANVLRLLEGQPYGPEDLHPDTAPLLVETAVPEDSFVDAVSAPGLTSLGLPPTYPRASTGTVVPHDICQPIGQAAWDAGHVGIACRSAVAVGEELAWFQRSDRLRVNRRRTFDEWFW